MKLWHSYVLVNTEFMHLSSYVHNEQTHSVKTSYETWALQTSLFSHREPNHTCFTYKIVFHLL